MNRYQEMNNFLHYFANLYQSNPNLEISLDTIYDALSNYGLTHLEQSKEGSSVSKMRITNVFFYEWIESFKNDPFLSVYHTDLQSRFLQFSGGGTTKTELYKLYLSFPENKILDCIKILFKYISENKIANVSKVADSIRSDSVVLRLYSQEDVKKIIDYIDTNIFINSSCKQTNPFAIKAGKIALSYDKNLSYNEVLSFVLKEYFISKKNTNALDSVSLEDLRNYVANKYNSIYSNKDELISFMNNNFISTLVNRHNNNIVDVLTNVKDIMDIISLQLDPNSSLEDYFKKVETFKTQQHNEDNYNLINNLIDKQQNNSKALNENEIVNNYIIYALKKYGDTEIIISCLENYMLHNMINSITRDALPIYKQGFRTLFSKYISPEKLQSIVGNNVRNYVNTLLESNKNTNKFKIFYEVAKATHNKYGIYQLMSALNHGMNGDYSYFTNDGKNMYREKLKRNVDQETFNKYANLLLKDIDQHLQNNNTKKI